MPEREIMPKILIHDMSMRGDMLMSSPAYKAFKDAGWETHSICYDFCKEILEGNPYIDRIWTAKSQLSAWRLIPKLRVEQFSYVAQLNTSFKTNLFLSTLGSISIGYSYKWKGLPLDIKIPIDRPTCREGNRIEEIDDLIFQAFGLRLEPKMICEVGGPTNRSKTFITVCPCSARHKNLRQWETWKWARVVDSLVRSGYTVYLCAIRKDWPYLDKIIAEMKERDGVYRFGWDLDLRELVREIGFARLLITVNSFPLHLGISQGTPTLALIGRTPKDVIVHPSVEKFYWLEDKAIWDKSLKPMNFTVEEVLDKVKEALK